MVADHLARGLVVPQEMFRWSVLSLKRKQPHQSDSVDDNEDEDKDGAEDDVNDDERRKNAQKLDYLVGGEQRIITIQEHDNVVWTVRLK